MRARRHGIRRELIAGIIFIIVLSGAATFFGTLLWSRSSFDDLVQKNDKEFAQSIADAVAPYYSAHGSWRGIETEIGNLAGGILRQASSAEDRGREGHPERGYGIPLVIADPKGLTVYSAIREPSDALNRTGRKPERLDVSDGVRVSVGGETVGYVFFKSMLKRDYNPHETAFMASLAASIGVTAFLGILLALALGSAFAGRFVRPIVELDEAVRKIADGETGVRANKMRDDEIGNLADNFNVMAEKLERNEAARRNLLADMAHELRTPVSVIQANLEMIIEGVYAPDKARLESLYDETRILTDLIASLRDISDLESGVAPMNPHPVYAYPILAETLEKYGPLFAAQDISLSMDASGGDRVSSLVLFDENRLRQIVRNILVNALKYSGPHTSVSMSCETVGVGGRDFFRVTIADGGPGVPESDLEKIFERFYRVDSSRNRDSGGRGLGLAICRQFVEAGGGRIFARNRAPRGLEVSFDLPLCGEPSRS